MNYFIDCLTKKYACFSGRARRQEYWLFVLFNFIASTILKFIAGALISMTGLAVLAIIPLLYSLAVWIVLIVFCCLDSQPGDNQYGPNPKGL